MENESGNGIARDESCTPAGSSTSAAGPHRTTGLHAICALIAPRMRCAGSDASLAVEKQDALSARESQLAPPLMRDG